MKKANADTQKPIILGIIAIIVVLALAAFVTVKMNDLNFSQSNVQTKKFTASDLKKGSKLKIGGGNLLHYAANKNLKNLTYQNSGKLTNLNNKDYQKLNYVQFAALVLNFGTDQLNNKEYAAVWKNALASKKLEVRIMQADDKHNPLYGQGTIYEAKSGSRKVDYTITSDGSVHLFGQGVKGPDLVEISSFSISKICFYANQSPNRDKINQIIANSIKIDS